MTDLTPRQKRDRAELYGKALARLRKMANLNQHEAALRAGIQQGTLSRYETGGNTAILDEETLYSVVTSLGFTLEQFQKELAAVRDGQPLVLNQSSARALEAISTTFDQGASTLSLEFPLDGTVRAGPAGFAVYDDGEPQSFDLGHFIDRHTRILTVMGESMVPILEPGAHVTYTKRGMPKRNSLAVIRFQDGQYFVKKFVRVTDMAVECIEMEQIQIDSGRQAFAEKLVKYDLKDVKAIYPAQMRID